MRRFLTGSYKLRVGWIALFCAMLAGMRGATIIPLYTFTNTLHTGVDGGTPVGGLIQASNGVIYGTTVNGGTNTPSNGAGSIFKITTNGVFTPLYTFTGGTTNGGNLYAGVRQGTNGSFYGTAFQGGSNSYGSVFKLTSAGAFSELYGFTQLKFHTGLPFTNTDGANPVAGLIQGTNGNFYGTAPAGGTNGYGAVFAITNTGAFLRLHSFTNGPDGANPGALFQSSNGLIYGTTTNGGTDGYGTIFKFTAAGQLTPLYSFAGGVDGAFPGPALVQGTNGVLYGTASGGGSNSAGTIFQITTNGVFTPLYSFSTALQVGQVSTNADGLDPGPLAQGSDGNFYGYATFGGLNGTGTLFEFSPVAGLTVLYNFFTGPPLGNGLYSNSLGGNPTSLMQGRDGSFYGAAKNGGSNGFGLVFQLGLPPQITAQPVDRSMALNAKATFSIAASVPACQWLFNGTNLPNATNLTLTNFNIQITNAGPYQAVVSNLFGCATSAVAMLNITNVPVSFATGAGDLENSGGQFSFVLTNLTGQGSVVIYFSTDLSSWSPILTIPPSFGVFQYLDSSAGENLSGYYRAAVTPGP